MLAVHFVVSLAALLALLVQAEAWTIPGESVQAELAGAQRGAEPGSLRHLALGMPGDLESQRADPREDNADASDGYSGQSNSHNKGELSTGGAPEAHGAGIAETGGLESEQEQQQRREQLEAGRDADELPATVVSSAAGSGRDEPVGIGARIIKGFGGGFIG